MRNQGGSGGNCSRTTRPSAARTAGSETRAQRVLSKGGVRVVTVTGFAGIMGYGVHTIRILLQGTRSQRNLAPIGGTVGEMPQFRAEVADPSLLSLDQANAVEKALCPVGHPADVAQDCQMI